jgi:outer membrane protein TolC
MHIETKILLLSILGLLFLSNEKSYAQEQEIDTISDYSQLSNKELQNINLPPLSVLFENLKRSPRYQFPDNDILLQKRLLAKQKKDFLSFFSIRGSYQYGRIANDAYYSDVYTPATTNFSSSNQNLYTVGAGMNISLDKLLDIGPSIKRQRLAVRSAELEREIKYEELKKEVIELYSSVTLGMSTLKLCNEALVQATMQYDVTENNFANGKATPYDLAVAKAAQSKAKREFETCKNELIRDMMTLELTSHTSVLKKK